MLLLAWMILLKRLKRELVVDTSYWIELLLLKIQSYIESTRFETHSRITKVLNQIGECIFYQQIQLDLKLQCVESSWIKNQLEVPPHICCRYGNCISRISGFRIVEF